MTMTVDDKNKIAITFDDGPSIATTIKILDLLKKHRKTATFFFSGNRAEQNPELVERVVSEGHQVFSHGFDHLRLDTHSPDRVVSELDRAEAVLSRFRPTPSPYFLRMPYGSGHGSAEMHKLLRRWRKDCVLVHWRCSLQDWTLADECADEEELSRRCEAVVNAIVLDKRLGGSIVLLHEDPFDIAAELSSEIAPILLEKLLVAAEDYGFSTAPVSIDSKQSRLWRFIRPVGVA